MVEQIFLSLQRRQSVIISNKHGIYTFPHEMSNDLKTQENLKSSQIYCLELSAPPEMKILSALVKISCRTDIALFPQCAISHEN